MKYRATPCILTLLPSPTAHHAEEMQAFDTERVLEPSHLPTSRHRFSRDCAIVSARVVAASDHVAQEPLAESRCACASLALKTD